MSSSPLMEPASAGDWSVEDAFEQTKNTVGEGLETAKQYTVKLWGLTSRRMRAAGGIILFTLIALSLWKPEIPMDYERPKVSFEYSGSKPVSAYNETKVALLIENRANPILAPLMLHFMSVVPPDWRFRFMGSVESVAFVNSSLAIRNQVKIGKLDLTYIPANMSTGSQEMISRFLTNLWVYEQLLQPAENLLVFQTDSMLCANSRQSLNEWLEYDWVGAPWNPNGQYGGNGGLSLRRVSSIVEILRNQVREDGSQPEDVWLTDRLGHRVGAKMANGTASLTFSGEMFSGEVEHVQGTKKKPGDSSKKKPAGGGIDSTEPDTAYVKGIDDWRDGFYEPMGYHTGGSGTTLHGGIWGTPEMRKHIWDYCPEVKLIFQMDAAEYVPGECNTNWKRGLGEDEMVVGPMGEYMGWDESNVDENGYPYLPANLRPF